MSQHTIRAPKVCPRCFVAFLSRDHRAKFCSRSCSASFRLLGKPLKPAAERFWKKVVKAEGDACWIWIGTPTADGYGHFWPRGRRGLPTTAHRFAYAAFVSPIPPGLQVLHACDNRKCVRPDHLFLGTNADNMADRNRKGRQIRGERHHQAKLTEDDVRSIRAERACGVSSAALAVKHGISRAMVNLIASRKYWRHIQ